MAQFDKDGHLIVKGNQYQVGELTNKLILMQGEELVEFLKRVGLNIPRKLRMGVLKNVLRQSVEKTIEERKSLADEMGYRLTWFSRYTDSQLVNLLEWYKSPSLSKKYLEEIWVALLAYMVDKGVSEADLHQLFTDALNLEESPLPSTKQFNQELEDVLYDEKDEIDGVTQAAFRPVTYKASTLTELRAIGDKFDAPIPKRLRKQEVLDIILVKLKERGTLTAELEAKLSGQNILLLERYAKDNDIKVSTELKKEEIIEYILANAKETREVYFVPSSSAVYEQQVEEVEESFTTEPQIVIEEPVVEEVVQEEIMVEEPVNEVVEEKVKVVERVEYKEVIQGVDYKPEFERLAKAFETLANAFEKKEFTVNINPIVNIDQVPTETKVVDNSKLIKELLMDDEDFSFASTQTVEQVVGNTIVKESELSTEVKQEIEEEILEPVVVGKKFTISKRGSVLAGLFAVLSGLVWLAFAIVMLPIEGLNQQATIQEYITFFDLSQFNTWIYVGAGALLAVFNFIISRFLFKRKIGRGALVFFGLISLVSGFGITGLIMLLASFGKAKPILAAHPKDGVGRIVEAINNLGTKMGVSNKPAQGKKAGKTVLLIVFFILFIAMLIFMILFGIWRLEFTLGYENIEMLNLGAWLRDTIIIPIFGSAHHG